MKRSHWFLVSLLAGVSVVAINNWKEAEKLRRMTDVMRRSNQTLLDELAAPVTNENPAVTAELEQLRKDKQELLRLRSETTQLRSGAAEAATLRSENQKLIAEARSTRPAVPAPDAGTGSNQFPREGWSFSGYATPEAALVSAIWAMREGNPKAYWDSLSPEEQARLGKAWETKSEADIAAKHQQDTANITSLQILNRQIISPDEMVMSVYVAGVDRMEQVSMKRSGGEWKFAGFIHNQAK